jgi:hypothetical protein
VENLEMAKQEVEKEFAELHAKKQELQIWRREAEETLQNRIDSFVKGKEELTSQIQELVNRLLPLPISSLIPFVSCPCLPAHESSYFSMFFGRLGFSYSTLCCGVCFSWF